MFSWFTEFGLMRQARRSTCHAVLCERRQALDHMIKVSQRTLSPVST